MPIEFSRNQTLSEIRNFSMHINLEAPHIILDGKLMQTTIRKGYEFLSLLNAKIHFDGKISKKILLLIIDDPNQPQLNDFGARLKILQDLLIEVEKYISNLSVPRLGLDFDGILHNSFHIALDTLNRTLVAYGKEPVTENWLKENFTTQWTIFFNRLQIPESEHKAFHKVYRNFEINNPLGELVKDSKEFLQVAIEKFGRNNVILISNNQEAIISKFFIENKLPQIKIVATPHGKTQTLIDEKITLYVGDIIDDGKAAIAAKCKFLGLAHYASFGSDSRMPLFAQFNHHLGVSKVNSLKDASQFLMTFF